jgi:predicted dehydrogenase
VIVLIIGLGSVGGKHVKAILKIAPGSIIYALRSSPLVEVVEDVKNIFSLDELKDKPDFVIISTPTAMHRESIEKILELGCPLFIEKPVFSSLDRTDKLIKQLNGKHLITYIACNLRFHPAIQYIRSYLQSKSPRINEVTIYCGSYLPGWRPGKDFRTSYSANAAMGGGVHLDLIHELDYCTWLFGMPLKVSAEKSNHSALAIDAVDFARFQFTYPSFTAGITLNYYRRDPKRELEIVTDEDTIVADLLKNRVTSKQSGKVLYEEAFDMSDTYLRQMEYFMSHINQNLQPMNGMAEGIEVLKLALHE